MKLVIKCKHVIEENVDLDKWSDSYPHQIFATVLLLDGKIENWWIGKLDPENQFQSKDFEKTDSLDDYKIINTSWEVNTQEEHDMVFNKLSTEWFKQWKVTGGFKGFRPY